MKTVLDITNGVASQTQKMMQTALNDLRKVGIAKDSVIRSLNGDVFTLTRIRFDAQNAEQSWVKNRGMTINLYGNKHLKKGKIGNHEHWICTLPTEIEVVEGA